MPHRVCLLPLLFGFLLIGLAGPAVGQRVLRGQVQDAVTGTPLAAATLQVEGTTLGTITNADGRFEVRVPALPAVLLVRFIGYETARYPVAQDTPSSVVVVLTPAPILLDEVVVGGEDPAVGIMRRVLAQKAQWRGPMTHYQAEVYTRFLLYQSTRLVQMRETIGETYWRPGQGPRELVRARRLRPDGTGTFRFAQPTAVPDFYDDNVAVDGFTLAGPTHPDALDIYTFTLGGRRLLDDQIVYDIYLAPKPGHTAAFIGHVAVLDSAFVLLEARLRPHPDNVRPPPIQTASVQYVQHFMAVGTKWLPVDLLVEGDVAFGRAGVSYPPAQYSQVSRLTRHVVDVPGPDSLFQRRQPRIDHPFIAAQNHLFRWNPGLVPLTPAELEAVVTLDPRMTLGRAFRPAGLLAGYAALPLEAEAAEAAAAESEGEALIGRLGYPTGLWVWFNRVDGWHVGLRNQYVFSRAWRAEGGLAYDTKRARPSGEGTLTGRWSVGTRRLLARLEGGALTAPRYPSAVYPRTLSGLGTYVGLDDYTDYYHRDRLAAAAGVVQPTPAGPLGLTVGLAHEQHAAVARNSEHPGWFFGTVERENPAIVPGQLRALTAQLALGTPPVVGLLPGGRSLVVDVEHSLPGLGSDYAFTTLRSTLHLSVPTLFRRRAWPGALHLRLTGGTFRGALPLQRFGALDAALGPIAAFGSFRSRRERPYEGERYAGVFWEHDFGTWVFEKMRLWPLARRGLGVSVYGAHGRTWIDPARRAALPFVPSYTDRFHHEVGASLTHPFGFPIRFDLTYRLDQPGFYPGVGLFRSLGTR